MRNCCDCGIRCFEMDVRASNGREVIHFSRPCRCNCCCCPCCLQVLEVSSPPDYPIGTVEQQWTLCFPRYKVKDEEGETLFVITGPCCTQSCCCNDVKFEILTEDESYVVGAIYKLWSGVVKEGFTDSDNYYIDFPSKCDVKEKALLIGAAILIDFMYFERNANEDDNNND